MASAHPADLGPPADLQAVLLQVVQVDQVLALPGDLVAREDPGLVDGTKPPNRARRSHRIM